MLRVASLTVPVLIADAPDCVRMGRYLNRRARILHLSIAALAVPAVTGVIDVRIGRDAQLHAPRGAEPLVTSITFPIVARGHEVAMLGHYDCNALSALACIAPIAIPAGIENPIEREGMG